MRPFCIFMVCISVLSFIKIGNADNNRLKKNFYKKDCPQAEELIRQITWRKARMDPALGAKLLRLQFHDCFARGCDASILLDTIGTTPTEKDARASLSLLGFDVIDDIKAEIEKVCPDKVSCADILALSARDSVSFQFKKDMWPVFTGRRDGVISLASDVTANNIPSANANFTTLLQIFTNKGLNAKDLVILSGAHTIGVSHCGAFSRRLNFTGNGDVDPSLDPAYAATLRRLCTPSNPATTVEMDPQSSLSFDNHYYDILTEKKGLFTSDAALLTNPESRKLVEQLAKIQNSFFAKFASSMKKMANIEVLTGNAGEIRKQCRFVN